MGDMFRSTLITYSERQQHFAIETRSTEPQHESVNLKYKEAPFKGNQVKRIFHPKENFDNSIRCTLTYHNHTSIDTAWKISNAEKSNFVTEKNFKYRHESFFQLKVYFSNQSIFEFCKMQTK